jgi:hypothetical protein
MRPAPTFTFAAIARAARICCLPAAIWLFLWPPSAAAQERPLRALRIERLNETIRVDGKLDEAVWQRIAPAGDFVQTEPDEGAPVSERTEVRVFYDDDNLYFAFSCYDSEPTKIIGRLDAHDARTFSDSVDIFLDPFGDRRTGYWFSVNARGVQFDGLLSEASGMDRTWDGIWRSATHWESWGWTAEIAIPFKSIRFAAGRDWGINLSRDIVRKNERAHWQFVARFDGMFRPSKAGTLTGIERVRPGRNVELIPYFSARARRGAPLAAENKEKYEGGLDVRWGLLPNATLNLAVNPDFADTEADEFNITISRFELFFPEKRPFFNEGSNFFATPLDLFFTRRVGERLPDGQPQRILFGGKLTGKVGGWSLGLLESRTLEQHFTDPADGLRKKATAANFFVLRMQRDVFKSSSLGFSTVNRDQLGASAAGSTQRAHGVDFHVVKGQHFRSSTQFAFNQNESNTLRGWSRAAFNSGFNFETNTWEIDGGYQYIGRGVDLSAIGFEPESDRHSADASITWKPFLNRGGVRQIFFEINQDISLDTAGLTQDSGSDADLRVQFQNFWSARVRYSYDLVRFHDFGAANCPPPFACRPAFGRLAPTRAYITPRVRLFFNTNENRPFFLSYQFTTQKIAQFRENFYGRSQTHFLGLTARLLGRTRVQFSGTIIREFLLDRTPFQNRRLFIARVNHQFTPKLRARLLAQFSNDRLGENYSLNSIVAYDFTARSAAIVGYNYQRSSPALPSNLGNEFFVKLSYLLHF